MVHVMPRTVDAKYPDDQVCLCLLVCMCPWKIPGVQGGAGGILALQSVKNFNAPWKKAIYFTKP